MSGSRSDENESQNSMPRLETQAVESPSSTTERSSIPFATLTGEVPRSPKSAPQSPASSPASRKARKGDTSPARLERLAESLCKNGTTQELRLRIAKTQREMLKELRPLSAGGSYTSISALTHLLEHRFGSITAAWRTILDPNMKGKASFQDFCHACRDVGFCRKIKPLWKQMTQNRPEIEQGYIELEHLDAEAAAFVKEFRLANRERHGNMAKAWQWFDSKKKTRVDIADFRERFIELGIAQARYQQNQSDLDESIDLSEKIARDAERTFNLLKLDPGRPYLVSQDFDERALQCCYHDDWKNRTKSPSNNSLSKSRSEGALSPLADRTRPGLSPLSLTDTREDFGNSPMSNSPMNKASSTGDLRPSTSDSMGSTLRPSTSDSMGSTNLRPSTSESMGSTTLSGARWSSTQGSASSGLYQSQKMSSERKARARSLEELRQILVVGYGSEYDAWRHALDVNDHGRLAFGEFCDAVRNIGFQGNLKDLWNALVPDKAGFVTLQLLDPATSESIESYKSLARKTFGCLLQAWGDLDPRGTNMVDETKFVRHCNEIGWTGPKDAKTLFHLLKHERSISEKDRKFMTLKEYDMKAYNARNRGHVEMLPASPDNAKKKVSSMDFQQRQDAIFTQRWARMAVKLDREDTLKHNEMIATHVGHQNAKALKELLIRKHGTITAGWKHSIDLHGSGRVAFGELCIALRRLGFCGKPRDVFIELLQSEALPGTIYVTDEHANKHINGVYTLQDGTCGGGRFWKRTIAGGGNGIDVWLLKFSKTGAWYISSSSMKNSGEPGGWAFSQVSSAIPTQGAGQWKTWDGSSWQESSMLVVEEEPSAERKAEEENQVKRSEEGVDPTKAAEGKQTEEERLLEEMQPALKESQRMERQWRARQAHDARLELKAAEKEDELADDVVRSIQSKKLVMSVALEQDMVAIRESGIEGPGGSAAVQKVISLAEKTAKAGADKTKMSTLAQNFREACHKKEGERTDVDNINFSDMEKMLQAQLGVLTELLENAEADKAAKEEIVEKLQAKADAYAAEEVEDEEETSKIARGKSAEQEMAKTQDKAPKGFLTLASFDAAASAMLKEFRELLIENYGTYTKAWQELLDTNRNNAVEEEQFVQACKDIEFSKDPKLLFKNLLEGPGKTVIRLADLDPASFQEFQRGGMEVFQPLDKAKAKEWTKEWLHASGGGFDAANDLYWRNVETMDTGVSRVFTAKVFEVVFYSSQTSSGPAWCIQRREDGTVLYQTRVVHDPHDLATAIPPALGWAIFEGENELPGKKAPVPKIWFPQAHEWLQVEGASTSGVNDFYRRDVSKLVDGAIRVFTGKAYSLIYYPVYQGMGRWFFQKNQKATWRPYAATVESDPIDVSCATPPICGWVCREEGHKQSQTLRISFPQASSVQHKAEQAKRMTACDWKTFKVHLIRKYGTITAAWRHGLDHSGTGKLSFIEFCKECRSIGYTGNVRKMFDELDIDGSGIITYNELDPRWYTLLEDFHSRLLAKYQTYQSAFKALDVNGRNGVDEADFIKACKDLGYVGDAIDRTVAAKDLFKELKSVPGQLTLALEDIEAEGCTIFGVSSATPCAKHKAKSALDKKFVISDWKSLKAQLIKNHGTLEAAWRDALDPSGKEQLSSIEFGKACLGMGYGGDAHKVFDELDVDCKGVITYNEVENHNDEEIEPFSPSQSNTAPRSPSKSLRGLLQDQSLRPKPYKKRDSNMFVTVDEKAKSILKEMDLRRKNAKDKQQAPSSLASLKQLFIRRYGTMTAAWRHGLDYSGNGKVSFLEFSKGCREVGFAGNIKAAFSEIKALPPEALVRNRPTQLTQKGIITFNELEPEWYEKLSRFRDLLVKKYGKLDDRCARRVDRNGNGTIEVEDLKETCADIGYELDAAELFEQLKRDLHRKFITMDDIRAKGVITQAVDRYPEDRSLSPTNSQQWSPQASMRSNSPKRSQFERSLELSQPVSPKMHPTRYFCSGC